MRAWPCAEGQPSAPTAERPTGEPHGARLGARLVSAQLPRLVGAFNRLASGLENRPGGTRRGPRRYARTDGGGPTDRDGGPRPPPRNLHPRRWALPGAISWALPTGCRWSTIGTNRRAADVDGGSLAPMGVSVGVTDRMPRYAPRHTPTEIGRGASTHTTRRYGQC